MNIKAHIDDAERRYKRSLEEYLSLIMKSVNLESHGPDHHSRVWSYAKQIIAGDGFEIKGNNKDFVKKLLIASFLHDSGMVIDTGPRHGIHSRSFCEKFLTGNGERTEDFHDLLNAIEMHDNKEYQVNTSVSSLDSVLNIADDLDAFGYTGIYRYLEIYIERKTDYKTVGEEIRSNAASRYRNIERMLKSQPEIISIHKPRYLILDSFFSNYNNEARSYSFATGTPTGYCGVAELIGEMVAERGNLNDLLLKAAGSKYGKTINQFFISLGKEITNFSNEI